MQSSDPSRTDSFLRLGKVKHLKPSYTPPLSDKGLVMSPSIPDDHKRSTWRRCVLLASDTKNSGVSEVLAGGTNYLAFSPYGERSSQKEVMTHIGFSGELRERRIGWYVLGNGYRVYNPRLMRFHSPDKFSPFGKGGMHAYMYCGGEPVMRSDPTGEAWWFNRFADFWSILSPVGRGGSKAGKPIAMVVPNQPKGLWGVAEVLIDRSQHVRNASAGGKSRIAGTAFGTSSDTGFTKTTAPSHRTTTTRETRFVLEGNYGKRDQNQYSSVRTRDGLSISGTDSGTRQLPSSSRSAGSSKVSDIRR